MSMHRGKESDAKAEASLWERWVTEKDGEARSALFFLFSPWVRMIAGNTLARYPHPLAEWSDYMNFASLGLLQAIDRFDPSRNLRFQTFAESYVRGAILKGLSCYVRDLRIAPVERFTGLMGSAPLGEGDHALESIVNVAVGLAFGYFLELGVVEAEAVENNPLSIYTQEREREGLREYVDCLPDKERQIMLGHYYQCLSFAEISELLGITRSRVSQLHTQALKRIRQCYELAGDMDHVW